MRGTVLLTVALMAMMTVSGCIIGDDNETSPQDADGGPFGGNNTTSPSPRPTFGGNNSSFGSTPPTANITGDAENGTAPLTVNFTLEASDPDGDLHSWVLDFGDGNETNGTEVPEDSINHTYEAEGNFTANFTVVDAVGNTATSSWNVTVEAGAAGGEPLEYEESVLVQCPQCNEIGALGSTSAQTGVQGIDAIWLELAPEYVGAPFTVESSFGDPDVTFFEECTSGEIAHENAGGAESGTVPDGAGCIMAWEYLGGDSTITIKVG